ncbi:MAG: ArsR/SmtB family transcription factor [Desulfomonilia bacterium]
MDTWSAAKPVLHPDTVTQVRQRMPGNEDIYRELSDVFKVVGDVTRLKILFALCASEMCVGDIAAVLDMNHSAVSHQLRVLSRRKLVRGRKVGKVVYYSLAREQVKHLLAEAFQQIRA